MISQCPMACQKSPDEVRVASVTKCLTKVLREAPTGENEDDER